MRVYPNGAGLESTADSIGCIQTLGHDASCKTVFGVVGALYHLHNEGLFIQLVRMHELT